MDERGSVGDNVRAETPLQEGLRGLMLPPEFEDIVKRTEREINNHQILASPPWIQFPIGDNVRERSRST